MNRIRTFCVSFVLLTALMSTLPAFANESAQQDVIPSASAPVVVEDTAALERDVEHCIGWLRDSRRTTDTRNERRGLIVRCLLQRDWNLAVAYDEALAIVPRIGGDA